ncbi:MAG: Uma2 family endonuclease [Anaerolineae bacterium]|nr:Uma2 family endonuclease [Candidatus Roseilinea sp.]MDW8450896.1 Uma2 family endonuclease [Anaerolineae bacterium]
MTQRAHKLFTPEEYLAQEEVAQVKSEFFRGEIFAMAGGTPDHNTISANAIAALSRALYAYPCRVFTSDQRIYIEKNGLYTYPDVVVVCGRLQFAPKRKDTITNPVLIVEVLSDATRDYDRGAKFELYRDLPTLQHYLLIDSDAVRVEYYRRQNGDWLFNAYARLDDAIAIPLEAGTIELRVRDLYDKVEFEA